MRRRSKTFFGILFLAFVLTACKNEKSEQLQTVDQADVEESEVETADTIFVYVCGAVVNEGVYELPSKSRVYEAILQAGGFSKDAAITAINQAEVLEDEARIYVPTMDEVVEEIAESDGKVNLNTATKEELMTIPGVGESKAMLIIRYRESNGTFQTIEEIMNITGIKEGLFEKMKEYIKV